MLDLTSASASPSAVPNEKVELVTGFDDTKDAGVDKGFVSLADDSTEGVKDENEKLPAVVVAFEVSPVDPRFKEKPDFVFSLPKPEKPEPKPLKPEADEPNNDPDTGVDTDVDTTADVFDISCAFGAGSKEAAFPDVKEKPLELSFPPDNNDPKFGIAGALSFFSESLKVKEVFSLVVCGLFSSRLFSTTLELF